MKTLTCPNCSTQIPLEEAVTHQIREELQREFQAAATKREQGLSNRELKLAGMQAHLDKRAESLDKEVEQRIQAEADQIRANAKNKSKALSRSSFGSCVRNSVKRNRNSVKQPNSSWNCAKSSVSSNPGNKRSISKSPAR